MATSSGNTAISTSGSDGDQNPMKLDERKRKRMESNRESARRSRMRKQQHLDDLTAQIVQLRKENNQILQTINLTNQQFLNVDAQNSVLRAQMNELSQRLDSLNGIINDMNALGNLEDDLGDFSLMDGHFGNIVGYNHWDLGYLNQPIMASADALNY
ncbi:bZIP transcription factor 44-like [Silene latifolia]|uniref:bZIP transcription factor 44-like n=1 Tax=Silene latifolia TaxID=37657 RepID=UPI003D782649